MTSHLQVVGIGAALVDVLAKVRESFVEQHPLLEKGVMTLVDAEQASHIYSSMPPSIESSGGCAANTIAGIAWLGGHGGFIGKVNRDQLGEVFGHDMHATGVTYTTDMADEGPPTGRSLIQVTPDAERTMNTFLGMAALLEPSDIDDAMIANADILFCEGFMWDSPSARAAVLRAIDVARKAGTKVALSLNDQFCVERHLDEWQQLVSDGIDIIIGNDDEARAFYRTDNFDEACRLAQKDADFVALTRGAEGSTVLTRTERADVDAITFGDVVDTTGAGDLYASGFLFGICNSLDIATAGKLGSMTAGEVLGHAGARPRRPLWQVAVSSQ
jgi:sugar/nucleoside kinase (ribokinase family)